ncbi:MAG: DUF5995 family protein [Ginsengibacter sp.]
MENLQKEYVIKPLPKNIDEVINQLQQIIDHSIATKNCAGYFAVLYHKVTCKIKDNISQKSFEDCARMERLDVIFANRYIDAYNLWVGKKTTTVSWQVAFEAATDNNFLVLQHLLIGMNAHINLDLGIASASVMEGFAIDDIHNDFNTINNVLGAMINNMEDCLTKVNPLLRLLHLNWFKYDEMLVEFSMNTARDGAWEFAKEISGKRGSAFNDCLTARDKRIADLGKIIAVPKGILLKTVVGLIRLFEKKDAGNVMEFLGA